jgi:hypothetical protein
MIGLPLSSPRLRRRWRFKAKWFCVSEFVSAMGVMPCSGSVSTVIADSVIAVPTAVLPPDCGSGDAPIAGISGVSRAGRIIAIGNGSTGAAIAGRA